MFNALEEKIKPKTHNLLAEDVDELPTTSSCIKNSLENKQKIDEKQTISQSFVNTHYRKYI